MFLEHTIIWSAVNLSLPLKTEEEFLEGLTQGFPDDSLGRDDEDEGEDESEESEEETDGEREADRSQNGGRRSQSLQSPVERRADLGSLVSALQQEGETVFRSACFCTKTMTVCVCFHYDALQLVSSCFMFLINRLVRTHVMATELPKQNSKGPRRRW